MQKLIIREGPFSGREIPLNRDLILGRGELADISIEDPTLSRRHASITLTPQGCIITDLRSGNGTFVNENRIREATPLEHGDRLKLGSLVAEYQNPDSSPRAGVLVSSVRLLDDLQPVLQTMGADHAVALLSQNQKQSVDELRKRLQLVYDVGGAIGQVLDENILLPLILDKLFDVFPQAGRGFVMVYDGEAQLVPKAARLRRGGTTEIAVSRTLIRDAVENRRGILSADASQDERFSMQHTIQTLKIRSVVCVPMIAHAEVVGVIHLDGGEEASEPFDKDDMALLLGIAGQAALAISNARLHQKMLSQQLVEQDLMLAKRIQMRFLPSEVPAVEGYDFHDDYVAALEVGGDYYDYIELSARHLGIAVGDVSGKGVSGALYMAKLSSDVRYHAAGQTDPAEILTRVNRALARDLEEGMFVTLAFLLLDVETHMVLVASAGHPAPYVRRADGSVIALPVPRNPPVGASAKSVFTKVPFQLEPGDTIVIFTDGVTEAMNAAKQQYGDQRLIDAIRESDGTSSGIITHILRTVKDFAGGHPQSDDITLVCLGLARKDSTAKHRKEPRTRPLKAI